MSSADAPVAAMPSRTRAAKPVAATLRTKLVMQKTAPGPHPLKTATCAPIFGLRQGAAKGIPIGLAASSHRPIGLVGGSMAAYLVFGALQMLSPGTRQPEHAAFVSALVRRQADAAVTIAGPGASEGDPEEQRIVG